ncbi:MAG: hypoxanthine phosphoribosyltransferase [Phycisphaeraceae bacterium]|nr:hypoxanthine phosphoribosyltransferase [Phycisphaeraceae bacterium]
MQSDIKQVLIDRGTIARRVRELAEQITRDYSRPGASELELTLVPILTGSIIFVADLIRHLPLRMKIRVVSVSSYPGASTASKGAKLTSELNMLSESLTGSHILVIDDILDSGQTLGLVCGLLRQKGPASLKSCVLLRKLRPDAMAFPVDYVCFDIPDDFVVGYGLDYNDYYRNLPEVVTLRGEVLKQ